MQKFKVTYEENGLPKHKVVEAVDEQAARDMLEKHLEDNLREGSTYSIRKVELLKVDELTEAETPKETVEEPKEEKPKFAKGFYIVNADEIFYSSKGYLVVGHVIIDQETTEDLIEFVRKTLC